MGDAGSLRVGHEERERLVLVLRQQYAEGRLAPDELEHRLQATQSARTVADLDRIVADLPVARPSSELRRASAAEDRHLVGSRPDHRLALAAGVASYVRRGVWTVPPYLSLTAGMGTVKVDFQQAICPHPVVDVAVTGGLGSVVLVLPPGWGANTDQVGKGLGSVTNRVDGVPRPGSPLLVLHGSPLVGSIRVRYAGWDDRRRLRKALRRGTAAGTAGGIAGSTAGGAGTAGGAVSPGAPPWTSGPQDVPPGPRDAPR